MTAPRDAANRLGGLALGRALHNALDHRPFWALWWLLPTRAAFLNHEKAST